MNVPFMRFIALLLLILILYGAGMFCIAFWGDAAIASRMISGFGSMFAGVLGLGAGFFLGSKKE